jgi:hypothetical protein
MRSKTHQSLPADEQRDRDGDCEDDPLRELLSSLLHHCLWLPVKRSKMNLQGNTKIAPASGTRRRPTNPAIGATATKRMDFHTDPFVQSRWRAISSAAMIDNAIQPTMCSCFASR